MARKAGSRVIWRPEPEEAGYGAGRWIDTEGSPFVSTSDMLIMSARH